MNMFPLMNSLICLCMYWYHLVIIQTEPLCRLCMLLISGTNYLQQFCASAVNAIVSPFVLQDIALEAAHYLTRNNPTQVSNQLRSPTLNSLVQKCVQM